MNKQNKIKLELTPDTIQSSYLNLKPKVLDIKTHEFFDGSIQVILPEICTSLEHHFITVTVYAESLNDLMVVSQIKNIIDNNSKAPRYYSLIITSPIYSRYDRVMLKGMVDGFGAKSFAEFINSLCFSNVTYLNCHSNVLKDLTTNGLSVDQQKLVERIVDVKNYSLIAPDKGATVKNPHANLIFDKVRDLTNGNIIGMTILKCDSTFNRNNFIILDDICEGGRTFIECAKLFREKVDKVSTLDLYVTHGLFSNNAIPKLLEHFNTIYVNIMKQNIYDLLTVEQQERLVVETLIQS